MAEQEAVNFEVVGSTPTVPATICRFSITVIISGCLPEDKGSTPLIGASSTSKMDRESLVPAAHSKL